MTDAFRRHFGTEGSAALIWAEESLDMAELCPIGPAGQPAAIFRTTQPAAAKPNVPVTNVAEP